MRLIEQLAGVFLLFFPVASQNLVFNGDFEQGWVGFYTEYSRTLTTTETPNAKWGNVYSGSVNLWNQCRNVDHTTGSGKFFGANGDSSPTRIVWQVDSTAEVTAGYVYRFQAWVATLTFIFGGQPGPNLEFWLSPKSNPGARVRIGTMSPLAWCCCPDLCNPSVWEKIFADYTATFSGIATLFLINKETAGGGNDFAVDDIFFWHRNDGSWRHSLPSVLLLLVRRAGFVPGWIRLPFCINGPCILCWGYVLPSRLRRRHALSLWNLLSRGRRCMLAVPCGYIWKLGCYLLHAVP